MSSDILTFTEDPPVDESIEQCEYHEYQPITDANLSRVKISQLSIST